MGLNLSLNQLFKYLKILNNIHGTQYFQFELESSLLPTSMFIFVIEQFTFFLHLAQKLYGSIQFSFLFENIFIFGDVSVDTASQEHNLQRSMLSVRPVNYMSQTQEL